MLEAFLTDKRKKHHSFEPWCRYANCSTCLTSDNKLFDQQDLLGVLDGPRLANQEHVFRIFSREHNFLAFENRCCQWSDTIFRPRWNFDRTADCFGWGYPFGVQVRWLRCRPRIHQVFLKTNRFDLNTVNVFKDSGKPQTMRHEITRCSRTLKTLRKCRTHENDFSEDASGK